LVTFNVQHPTSKSQGDVVSASVRHFSLKMKDLTYLEFLLILLLLEWPLKSLAEMSHTLVYSAFFKEHSFIGSEEFKYTFKILCTALNTCVNIEWKQVLVKVSFQRCLPQNASYVIVIP